MELKSNYIVSVGGDGIHVINTGDWRVNRPVLNQSVCSKCGICLLYCPVNSIRKEEGSFQISYDYCKGCGICAHECPVNAIAMIAEEGK